MKIAFVTADHRDMFRRYEREAPSFGKAPAALLQGFENLPGVEIHVVSCTQKVITAPEKLAENIYYHSLHVPKSGWLRTGYQGCIRAVRRKVKEIQPDIVHGQGTERECAISATFSGFPNVVTVHGKMAELARLFRARIGSFGWCAARVENFTLPRTGGIICISDYVKNLVQRYGVPTWFIPNALQEMFFDLPQTDEKRDVPLLLNVGVISARKRQRELLQVLTSLRKEGLEFETAFIGALSTDNSYADEFQREFSAAQATYGRFSHIVRLKSGDFCRLFDTSSAMIHFSSEESFGLVFGEAMARNLYLFASDVGSIREMSEGVSGVEIFHLKDWDGLKNALRAWLKTDRFKAPKPPTSPAALVGRYHPTVVARQHLQVYREILAGGGKTAPKA
jgi:glycosyltransferase involved in cell wall biosynthesis